MRETLLYDALMQDCKSILTLKDVNLKYIWFNNSFLEILKKNNQSEILNKTAFELFEKDIANIIEKHSERIIKTHKQQTYKIKINENTYKICLYPIIRDGKLKAVLSSAFNISKDEKIKYKLLEKLFNLKYTKEKEKKLDERKELFIATLTHDLKNPLQSQICTLELLKKGNFGSISDNQKEIIEMLLESSKFMKELLYSVLTVYKYDNGLVKLNKKSFDLNEIITACILETKCFAKDKNIRIEYKNFMEECIISADENHIRRVIGNILNNALNYAFKDTLISIIVAQERKNISIKIKSISTPISEELKEHIFDKYISGMNSDKKIGIGLGLYFCKKVIEAHKGKIYLNSNNIENEFIINLPIESETEIQEKLSFN